MIFYFSGTGNSRWAAKRIADSTGDHLVFIPDVIDSPCEFTISENESAWLIFPVHGWRPPRLIRQFVGKLTIQSSNPTIHALCTAGDSIGKTMEILEGDLKKRGIRLGKTYSLIMPESYVGLPFMDVDTKEREQEKIKKAAEELERIVAPSGAEGVAPTLHRGPIPWFFSGPVGAFFVNRLVTDKHFHVIEDRCIKCGHRGRQGTDARVAAQRQMPHLLRLLPPLPYPRHRVWQQDEEQGTVLLWKNEIM